MVNVFNPGDMAIYGQHDMTGHEHLFLFVLQLQAGV